MIKYLIIMLDDASTSYCSYEAVKEPKSIDVGVLRRGIRYAMCENWMIQFLYPPFAISEELKAETETIDHHKIMPYKHYEEDADAVVFNSLSELTGARLSENSIYALRIKKDVLFGNALEIAGLLGRVKRLNIIITDMEDFKSRDFDSYQNVLSVFRKSLVDYYKSGNTPQLNILTDRISIESMNNCGAGVDNITLAPDGKFYVCPAFYYDSAENSIGNLEGGLDILNKNLYRLEYAPICRKCDAYQCRRCIWLNKKMTGEVNTPSHQQCVIAHLERNASREFLEELHQSDLYTHLQQIKEIGYLDPFEIVR